MNIFRKRSNKASTDSQIQSLESVERFRLKAHNGNVNAIVDIPQGGYFITIGDDDGLGVFSSGSGDCVARLIGHTKKITAVTIVDNGNIVSVSHDRTARSWSIPDGREVRKVGLLYPAKAVTSLPGGRFAVGMAGGYLSIHHLCSDATLHETAPIKVFGRDVLTQFDINDIRVMGKHIVAFSLSGVACLLDTETHEIITSKNLGVTRWTRGPLMSTAMSDRFLIISYANRSIDVRNARTYDLRRQIYHTARTASSVCLLGSGEHILYAPNNGVLCVQSAASGDVLWSVRTTREAGNAKRRQSSSGTELLTCFTVLSDGRIVLGYRRGECVILSPPNDIMAIARWESTAEHIALCQSSRTLETAISSAKVGEGSLSDCCTTLITYPNCSASFQEWLCAHAMLEMSVKCGEVPPTTSFNGQESHWFKSLYIALTNINLETEDDLRLAEDCLCKARSLGVIEGVEPILAAYHVTRIFSNQMHTQHQLNSVLNGNIFSKLALLASSAQGHYQDLDDVVSGTILKAAASDLRK